MTWAAIWVALDDLQGYLLETDDGVVAFDRASVRVVPIFSRPEHAKLFARGRDPAAEVAVLGHHELEDLVAFARGERASPPERGFDDWVLLDEIASAAQRDDDLESPHDHVVAFSLPADADAVERARAAIGEALDVARAVLVALDE